MKVKLKKYMFNRFGKQQCNFKIVEADSCCLRMENLINKKKIIPVKYESTINISSEINPIENSKFTYALSFLEEKDVFPIDICPFCGEQISSEIISEEDVTSTVDQLQKTLKHYTEKLKCYSSPSSYQKEITDKIQELKNQLNYYYYIN